MGETGEGRAQLGPTFLFASWRSMGEMGRAVRSQGPTFLFASWRSMGETGEGRAQPRPDLHFCELAQHGRNGEAPMRAGAAWEKRGRAVRSQGPTFISASWRSMGEMGRLPCELAQHGRNGEGRAQPRPDLPLPRAGAAWEKWGGPCAAKARPSSSASWRSMGEMGRAVRSQGPTFLFRELAQHGRNGEGRAQPRPDLPFCELAQRLSVVGDF